MKTYINLFKIIAIGAVIAVGLASCGGGKKNSGGGGSASGDDLGAVADAAKTVAKAAGKESPASDFTYDLSADGKGVVIKKYTGKGGKVVIPAKIEGLPVVELFDSSFYGESNSDYGPGYDLTSVVIPASVKTIRSMAFNRCEKLTSVTILGADVEIGSLGFGRCLNLSELSFPENASLKPDGGIGSSGAFDGCKKLPLAVRGKLNAMGFEYI